MKNPGGEVSRWKSWSHWRILSSGVTWELKGQWRGRGQPGIGVPEEEDKKKDREKILEEIIVENFPKMGRK